MSDSLLSRTDRRKYFVEHNVEGLLRADSAARASFYATAAQNGWMSRNEIRKKENLPQVEGADELTVQVNMSSVDDLPSNQPPAQAKSDVYNITLPEQNIELTPHINVKTPQVTVLPPNVNVKPPNVDVKVTKRGDVKKTITEYDENGYPKTVVEEEI